jgi:hypothetical protein
LPLYYYVECQIGKHFFLPAKGKLLASASVVPVVDGKAHVPLYSINGLAGIGFAFKML